jgi:hypothetical protein
MSTHYQENVMIENYDAWGSLVEKWARGNDRKYPLPRDLDDIKKQCIKMAVEKELTTEGDAPLWRAVINLPDTMKGLAILQNSQEVLAIRLPAKKALEEVLKPFESQAAPRRGEDPYPLPPFYATAFGNASLRVRTNDEKKAFLLRRIGDYSVSNCA